MSDLRRALRRLGHHPVLRDLTTSQILAFCRLTSCLKNDILLVQHASIPVDRPPRFLSVSLVHFLAEAMSIHPNLIQVLWEEMRFVLWGLPSSEEALLDDEGAFHTHGEPRGISAYEYYVVARDSNLTTSSSSIHHVSTICILYQPRLSQNTDSFEDGGAARSCLIHSS